VLSCPTPSTLVRGTLMLPFPGSVDIEPAMGDGQSLSDEEDR
jgi:hypothetical protein